MKELSDEDLLKMAIDNIYNNEYSMKLTIPCRTSTNELFKQLKERLTKELGVKITNARCFEFIVIELYNGFNHKTHA